MEGTASYFCSLFRKDLLMRMQPSWLWLWGCWAALACVSSVHGQDFSNTGWDPSGAVSAYGTAPGMGPDAYFQEASGQQALMPMMYQDALAPGYPPDPGMAPPGMAPYPNVSPYGPPIEQYYQQDGLWVNNQVNENRAYYFSLEYIKTLFNRPGTDLVGAPGIDNGPLGPTFLPYAVTNVSVLGNGEDVPSDGIRGRFVIKNTDGTAFEIMSWWAAEGSQTYHPYGRGNPGDPSTFLAPGLVALKGGNPNGVGVRFDTDFKLGYKAQAYGSDLNWTTMPIWETSGVKVRGVFGMKYMKIREYFSFHGEDSGLAYVLDPVTGAAIPPILPNPLGLPAFTSDLTSRTSSNLVGPEGGIRYEIGGQKFTISGQSKLAVVANIEEALVYGNQIGDGFLVGFPTPTPANPKPAFFRDTQNHSHVSPIFDQTFQFKGKVFSAIPVLRKVPMLANADMLLGYQFILVGNVVRPTKIIDWRVDRPRIDLTRSRWSTQNYSFGLQWQY